MKKYGEVSTLSSRGLSIFTYRDCAKSLISVSYTHLDVYKRQLIYETKRYIKLYKGKTKCKIHLHYHSGKNQDVYKRQHVYKVNTNFDGELADEYEVTANPTLLFVKDAEVLARKIGVQKHADLKAWVEALL